MDEFGPLNLVPRPGRQWAPVVPKAEQGLHLGTSAAKTAGDLQTHQGRTPPAGSARHQRRHALRAREDGQEPHDLPRLLPLPALAVPARRCASPSCMDNYSALICRPKRTTGSDAGPRPTTSSSLTCRRTRHSSTGSSATSALRYFALNGTDHRSHQEQNSMIRRYIAWRNRHRDNEELRAISLRAKVA